MEYSLIVAFIALAAIAGIAYMQRKTGEAFEAQGAALAEPTFAIGGGTAAPAYSYPAREADCYNNGWRRFFTPAGAFRSQGDCQSWVATNGGNAPASTLTPTATATPAPGATSTLAATATAIAIPPTAAPMATATPIPPTPTPTPADPYEGCVRVWFWWYCP